MKKVASTRNMISNSFGLQNNDPLEDNHYELSKFFFIFDGLVAKDWFSIRKQIDSKKIFNNKVSRILLILFDLIE